MTIDAHFKAVDRSKFLVTENVSRSEQILKLLDAAYRNIDVDRGIVRACLSELRLLLEDNDEGIETVARGGLANWQIKRIKLHIEAHISKPILIRDLAQLIDLSASHFSRAFITNFGEPPSAYILRRRVERAKELMMTTARPLCEIALESGMCDQSHFTRSFRRFVGVSPNLWRRSNLHFGEYEEDQRKAG
jgi:transcriptional regulator GlxA family with amidase domain